MAEIPATKLREIVLQILYSLGLAPADQEALETLLAKELSLPVKAITAAYARAQEVLKNLEAIDTQIAETSQAYDPARIPNVERGILRLGVFELLFDTSIPPKVAISEAVRLARKFSSPEAAAFINAVLDSVYKKSLGEPVNTEQLEDSVQELKRSQELAEEASKETPPAEE